MVAESGNSLVDERLLGRPCECNGNSRRKRIAQIHKVLCSAAEIACKGRQDFYLGHDGGYMISYSQQNWSKNENSFSDFFLNWHGQNKLTLVHLENNIFNFYLNREVKPTESSNVNGADRCPTKNCQQSGNSDGRAVRS